ncbi:MAG TPA: hypothetical protein VHI72_09560, partial [Hyphomicrobiaceae bacterium]|nr:hypothetical protein [Hyphomicrobiaceae bacterium]
MKNFGQYLAKKNKDRISSMVSVDFQTKSKLAPTGRLRVAIAVGDAISAVWTKRDAATGQPRGPTV